MSRRSISLGEETVERVCRRCGKTFEAKVWLLRNNRSIGAYCSRDCGNNSVNNPLDQVEINKTWDLVFKTIRKEKERKDPIFL